jgi:uncharacterized protein YhbP (UPF0306 family)
MTTRPLEGLLRDLLLSQRFAVLTTQDAIGPYASLVAFIASDDLRRLIFATSRHTRKHKNLMRRSEVAILVDNRSNSPEDISAALAVTALGLAREVSSCDGDSFREAYLLKHPYLADFIADPNCALFVVSVSVYNGVKALGDTFEWRPDA